MYRSSLTQSDTGCHEVSHCCFYAAYCVYRRGRKYKPVPSSDLKEVCTMIEVELRILHMSKVSSILVTMMLTKAP